MFYAFEDKDGQILINYQQMLLDVYEAIQNGVINPMMHWDSKRNRHRLAFYKSPHYENKMELWNLTRTKKHEIVEEF